MATYPEGTLLKASGPEVDRMEGGQRRWIPDPPTFTCMGMNWGAIKTISDTEWNQIPKGAPYPSRADGALLQGSGPQVYVMAGCQRHWIPDPVTFTANGYDWSAIQHISDVDLTAIPEGIQLQQTLVQIQQKHLELTQQMATMDQQLQNMLAQLGESQQMSAADLISLQSQMATYTVAAEAATNITKEVSDTLKSITQKIG
jgi:hypothetical protein